MSRSKLKKQLLTTFLAVAMTFTSINVGPIGAVTAYAESPAKLAAGDYYILNTATGRLLNNGNAWGTQASALSYGQLMTLSVVDADNGIYNIDSHILGDKSEKHFLNVDNGNAFLDGLATPLTIVKCDNGNYTIANADGGYLTASNENTVVTYMTQKSDLSDWRILTCEQFLEYASENATEENPVDVTSLILNPNFDRYNQYSDQWSSGIKIEGAAGNYCAEVYGKVFDSMQTLENVPNGVYELSVQGFYRKEKDTAAPAIYYINGTEAELKTIEADGRSEKVEGSWSTQRGDVFVTNSMTDSSNCFSEGAYTNDFITATVTDHTLKIGVKTTDANSWVIWDNFILRLKEVTEEEVTDAEVAASVVAKINAIGTVALTDECDAKIKAARAAYDALSADQKTSVTNYNTLEAAEAEYDKLFNEGGQEAIDQAAAKEVLDKIDAIGTVEANEESKVKINDAWMLYNALTDAQKALITADQLKVLTDAEAKFVELMGDQMPSEELKKELAAAVENANAEALVEEAYTKESWQVYKEALDTLHTLSQQVITTKPEIETALKALKEASDGLKVAEGYEPTEDQKTNLTTSVDNAANLEAGKYEKDENWTAFQKALKRAQEIKNRPNATAAQVEKAMRDLEEAIANLKPVQDNKTVDKKALEKAVNDYGNLKSSNYTSTTWKAFKKALDAAKDVLKDEKATQNEVDKALQTLNAKKRALKKVIKVKSIKITADYTSVAAGKKAKLTTIVKPNNAANKAVKWSVAAKDKKYVSVSSKGVVSTKKAGAGKTVTVTATAKDGSKKKATIKIKIMKNAVTKITLKAKTKKVKAGKKVTVKATVKTNGKKANKKLAWKSSNNKYATVNAKGVVTTKKAGKGKNVTITAISTDGTNKKGTIKIKIVK
ncbi:Ig-like domain-containing protein [Lachnospiraceae bacterium 66-29]